MNQEQAKDRLCGCYVTLPTLFRDRDLELDLRGMEQHVKFLIQGGIRVGTGVLRGGW